MKQAKIGVIIMMLKKNFEEIGVYESLCKLKDIGYNYIEVSQLPMTPENTNAVRRACDDTGLTVAAMSAMLEDVQLPGAPAQKRENLADDFDKIVADCRALDCTFLRMGILPLQYLESKDTLIDFAHKADAMADRLQEQGISFYYHTHHFEFAKYDGQYALDIIKDNSSKIGFELDVHWIWRGGVDPVEFIKGYERRVKLLHLKDYRIGKVDLTNADVRAAMGNVVEWAEVGEGTLDMKAIIDAGLESGAEYLIVEQDSTYGRDAFESLQISRDNLVKLGYGDLF